MADGKSGYQVCKFRFRVRPSIRSLSHTPAYAHLCRKRLPGQRPIPRRDRAFRADFSAWERPKHFGSSTVPSVTSHTVRLISKNKTETGPSDRRLSHSPPPPRQPKPQAVRSRPPAPILAIPPTSNAVAPRSLPSPIVQTPVAAPQPNVLDLLAEWNSSSLRAGR